VVLLIADIRCSFAVLLIALSSFAIICQFGGAAQASLRRRRDAKAGGYSMVPLIGGMLGVIGCLTAPSTTIHRLWWVPLVVDPGCALMFAVTFVFLLWRATFGRKA
jgi:hypothetical protein